MKIKIEVDCTPVEARAFLGLPDVSEMQARLLAEMEEHMRTALQNSDSRELLDNWMPFGARGMEQWQQLWTQMLAQASGLAAKDEKDKSSGSTKNRKS